MFLSVECDTEAEERSAVNVELRVIGPAQRSSSTIGSGRITKALKCKLVAKQPPPCIYGKADQTKQLQIEVRLQER